MAQALRGSNAVYDRADREQHSKRAIRRSALSWGRRPRWQVGRHIRHEAFGDGRLFTFVENDCGYGMRSAVHKEQHRFTNSHVIAVGEEVTRYLHIVDEGAVGAAEIADAPARRIAAKGAVAPRDRAIGNADRVVRIPTDGDLVSGEWKHIAREHATDHD